MKDQSDQQNSETRPAKRQFIAGAVCPQCQELDRLVLIEAGSDPATYTRACVSCGFSESLESAPSYSLPNSIKDRRREGDDKSQVVRILDP